MTGIAEVGAALQHARRVLLASHVPPDGDGLGAGLALVRWLRDRGRHAVFAAGGGVQGCLGFLYREDEVDRSPAGPDGDFDVVVSLDAASRARLGGLKARFAAAPLVVNIDHHATNEGFGHVNWVDPDASSTGEMVYRLLGHLEATLTAGIAEPLYIAIVTDTGRFGFSNTTPAVHEMAAALIEAGVRPERITSEVYRSVPPSWLRLVGLAIDGMSIHAEGRLACVTATEEMIARSGADPLDVGDLVDIPISVAGVEVGVLFRPAGPDRTKVSLRSRAVFPVHTFAARFGGGGHPRAAGATLDEPIDSARELVLDALTEAVERDVPAGDRGAGA